MTYEEIVKMIVRACNHTFNNGWSGCRETILQCATQIYIEQMKGEEHE